MSISSPDGRQSPTVTNAVVVAHVPATMIKDVELFSSSKFVASCMFLGTSVKHDVGAVYVVVRGPKLWKPHPESDEVGIVSTELVEYASQSSWLV